MSCCACAEWLEDFPLEERRPDLSAAEAGCPAALVALAQLCWADTPEARPTVRERLTRLRDLVQPELEPEPEPDHPNSQCAKTMLELSPSQQGTAYYEVTVVNGGTRDIVGVGVAMTGYEDSAMPGWKAGSVGYHGDDGVMFLGSAGGYSKTDGKTFGTGDIVGCGVNFGSQGTHAVFFTLNGEVLELEGVVEADSPLQICIGLKHGAQVVVNTGQAAFQCTDVPVSPSPTPTAPTCTGGHACVPSSYNGGAYGGGGWVCNSCRRSGSGERWFCQLCSDDFCFRCNPKAVVPAASTTLVQVAAVAGWAIDCIAFKRADGSISANESAEGGASSADEIAESAWKCLDSPVARVTGINCNAGYLAHSVTLHCVSGASVTMAGSNQSWQADAFSFDVPNGHQLVKLQGRHGVIHGIVTEPASSASVPMHESFTLNDGGDDY